MGKAIFFQGHRNHNGNRVITTEKVNEIIRLHICGKSIKEIGQALHIKPDTLRKAISEKRLILPAITGLSADSTKSSRNLTDTQCLMGKSCSNELGRVLAARSGQSSRPTFGNHIDLSHGGILLTLPSLIACGLLDHVERFSQVRGYYTAEQVLISLAFLILLRVKNLEQSQSIPSGELGRCLGLDRIPEVKTLRERIAAFCQHTDINQWSCLLSSQWMQKELEPEGVLYVDGHVRLYSGSQVEMPKRFVSRMRLCLSGSTDYWINDRLGQPFFVVNQTLNEGMIHVLVNEIIPRLDNEIPNQPDTEVLKANPLLHRYMLVFDRECYSVTFFRYLQENRIAFCTYRKNVKDEWADELFSDYEVVDEQGEKEIIRLAECSTVLYAKKEAGIPQQSITVREIRKKSASGHQTAIITTNHMLTLVQIAVLMFSRWCQENFFKYMMESFGIDSITSYLKSALPDTSKIINPEYKSLEQEQKKTSILLSSYKVKYAEISLAERQLSDQQMEKYILKKAGIKLEIDALEKKKQEIIQKKKMVDKKILFREVYENQKIESTVNERKFFLDTIKIIAYRAETAMANLIKKQMAAPQQARSLIRTLYQADADIKVDNEKNILYVYIHRSNHWHEDNVLEYLCKHLNETQTVFPQSKLTIVFNLVSL